MIQFTCDLRQLNTIDVFPQFVYVVQHSYVGEHVCNLFSSSSAQKNYFKF